MLISRIMIEKTIVAGSPHVYSIPYVVGEYLHFKSTDPVVVQILTRVG